jgi:hypothetical protein
VALPPPPELLGGAGAAGTGVIVTCALPVRLASPVHTAMTVTVVATASCAGAVYRPVVEIVPTAALPPPTPSTTQVTIVFCVLLTVAENASDVPAWTLVTDGETTTCPRSAARRSSPPSV